MSHLPRINKILALLTTGILVTLLGALELAGWYVKHDFFNPVKGEPNDNPGFIFYTPAIVLTLALLLLLLFRHRLWHILFLLALVVQAAICYWIVDFTSTISGPSFLLSRSLHSLPDYLDYLPLLMILVVIIIYIIYRSCLGSRLAANSA